MQHSLIVGCRAPESRHAMLKGGMRVIAGEFRSRPLAAPRGMDTRPTSDRLRETLFNVLGSRVQGARFADLYAGSGAVGIEALSRGASFCLFAERGAAALAALRKNLAQLGVESALTAVDPRPVGRVLGDSVQRAAAFDLIFLDPPYEAEAEYKTTLGTLGREHRSLLADGGLVIAEHARRDTLPEQVGALRRSRLLEQGDAALSFYVVEPTAPSGGEAG